MRSKLLNFSVALMCASLLTISVSGCGGGSSSLVPVAQPQAPQAVPAAPSQPANSATNPSSAMSIISINNSDRTSVASHGAAHSHVWSLKKPTGGTTTQSVFYEEDLHYFNGPLITLANQINGYVNASAPIPGVKTFEQNLSRSNFSHILDQYVSRSGSNRYDWGADAGVSYPALTNLGDNDLLLIVHALVRGTTSTAGFGHIYNVFLPKGVNYCSTGTIGIPVGLCSASTTSPNPAFCAFHSAVAFSDIGNTIFTIIPYIDPKFCGVDNFAANPTAPTPNGLQPDSTFNVISHEVFEAITDAVPGSGWFNPNPFESDEIGDECAFLDGPFNSSGFVVPQNTVLNGTTYRIQFEYSNSRHACSNANP